MTMAATAGGVRTGGMTAEERKVIFASSLGTVFEWYDFYIYGTLGVFLAKYFFANVPPNVGFIFALLAFAAGFAVRPFGALIFGRLGDMIGRKYTFLITMTLMGVGTFFIGLLPGYGTWGIAAPVVLILLRLVQGLALGGEYGGAATYVAEHAPQGQARLLHLLDPDHGDARPVPRVAADPRHPDLAGRGNLRRLGLARSVPALGHPAHRLDLDPLEPERVAGLPEDEGRRQDLQAPAERSLRPMVERQDRDPCAVRRDRGRSRGVVWRTVLCAVLPDPDHQGRRRSRRRS